jgi:SprT protein
MDIQFSEYFVRYRIREEALNFFMYATQTFGMVGLENPEVRFSENTTKAGRAFVSGDFKEMWVEFNLPLAMESDENYMEFIRQIIPHEVCHLVARLFWGHSIDHHGVEWQATMKKFGLNPDRCHNMNTAKISRRSYEWKCQTCGQSYFVGIAKHSRMGNCRRGVCKSNLLKFVKNHQVEQSFDLG